MDADQLLQNSDSVQVVCLLPLRLMGRNADRLPQLGGERLAAIYEDPDSLARAFSGVERVLIVSGYAEPGKRSKLHKNALDAAAEAGVSHIVYLSFLSASLNSLFPMGRDHFWSEEYLRATGVPFTSLRDSFYLDLIPDMFNACAGLEAMRVSWVARDDVIRVVATVLENPAGREGTFDITGPESLTLQDTATQVSSLTGRQLRYEIESIEEGRAWRSRLGAPAWEVDTWLGSYEAIAAGELGRVSEAVFEITGAAPMNLRSYFSSRPALIEKLRQS
ncbi:MAG: NAD(P)H-binding protein [Bryobacteraceae bacterium]